MDYLVEDFTDIDNMLRLLHDHRGAERRGLGYEECLNGVAYDADADELFCTGKCWPKLFRLRVDAP